MVAQKGWRASALGLACTYCGEPMEDGGPRTPSRDHIVPRCLGANFSGGRNRAIVCQRCNGDKGNRTLRIWLNVLMRDGDTERASRVATFIAELYRDNAAGAADELSGADRMSILYAKRANPLPKGKTVCSFPKCACVRICGEIPLADEKTSCDS